MLFARRGRRSKRRRGAVLVEFALVVPVTLLFIFGLIELSRMVMVQQALTNAAQRGSREATLARINSSSNVEATVREYLDGALGPIAGSEDLNITISPIDLSSISSGDEVSVQVSVPSSSVSWVKNPFLGRETEMTLVGQSSRTRE
jgi:hypothetical protein